jgi:hypothetical protein
MSELTSLAQLMGEKTARAAASACPSISYDRCLSSVVCVSGHSCTSHACVGAYGCYDNTCLGFYCPSYVCASGHKCTAYGGPPQD